MDTSALGRCFSKPQKERKAILLRSYDVPTDYFHLAVLNRMRSGFG
jgi:hypothetical protein